MKKILLYGNTDLAELVYFYAAAEKQLTIEAAVVPQKFLSLSSKLPIKNIPFENIETTHSPNDYAFIVCVGYTKMNSVRSEIFKEINEKGYEIINYIHHTANIYSNNIGYGNIIFPNVTIDPYTAIGNGNIFYPCSILSHHSSIQNFNFFAVRACVAGHVSIKNNCFIGANATIKDNVNIESEVLIGANAYVSKDCSEKVVIVPTKSRILESKTGYDFY